MAYVNVADWTPDQVAEWLKGLDDVLQPYIHLFVTQNITGSRLLHLSSDDFKKLNISCIGHQEILLQGVELLSNIHYQIDQENVQHLALRLSSKARSIYNELRALTLNGQYRIIGEEEKEEKRENDKNDLKEIKKERVSTNVLSGVADVLSSVKILVSWLHRNPFHGIEHYDDLKSNFLDLSIRLATIAQRDSFAENPVSIIRESCRKLAEMADSIIQDSKDPLILQPAFLDVVTLKKRTDDNWGLGLYSSYHGVHQISMLRALSPVSPAYTCGKLMCGDQVVQVNYQTVVGWTSLKVTQLMQENPVQVILTVKKCPTHVNTITEIYFKPFRLPSKKRTYSPWINNTISHQQYNLQSIPNLQFIKSFDGRSAAQRIINTEPHPKSLTPPSASLNSSGSDVGAVTASESDSEDLASDLDDDAFLSDVDFGGSGTTSLSGRLFQPKPRPHVQRRATIPGASARHTLPFDHLLQGYCHRPLVPSPVGDVSHDPYQYVFRNNKDNLETRIGRPHTCIGTEKGSKKGKTNQWKRAEEGEMPFIDESDEKEELEWKDTPVHHLKEEQPNIKERPTLLLPPDSSSSGNTPAKNVAFSAPSPPRTPTEVVDEGEFHRRTSEERPRLDKSYSSPTYDLDDRDASVFLERNVDLNNSKPKDESPDGKSNEKQMQDVVVNDECIEKPNEQISELEVSSSEVASYKSSNDASLNSIDAMYEPGTEILSLVSRESDSDDMLSKSVMSSQSVTSSHSPYGYQNTYRDTKGDRRISCRDLGLGDHHGWLYRRKDTKGFLLSHRWEKRWFILKKSSLYGYRDKDSLKADSLIYLPGFHVCPASDVKSKRFAFKIYHSSGATFYFACDTIEERSRWMSQMGVSAISSSSSVSSQPHPQERESPSGSPEAYYSETDDELEKSPSNQRSSLSPNSKISPTKEGSHLTKMSGSSVASLVSSTSKSLLPSNIRSVTSGSSRIASLGSLSSLGAGKQGGGLRFLQSSKVALSHPLPTHNFRSYIRVRESPPTPPTPETPSKFETSVESSPGEAKERKGVRRKGSLRERLKQLPASLTLDRRKQKHNQALKQSMKTVCGSKSETSLLDPGNGVEKLVDIELSPDINNSHVPGYMRPTHAFTLHTDESVSNLSSSGRRGSIGGLSISSSSLRSLSPRRGSLDCLVSQGISPPVSPRRSAAGSTGSVSAQDEYREGSPEKLWINSLRSTSRLHATQLLKEKDPEKLKRAIQYQPLQRSKGGDTMQMAFELSLSGSPHRSPSPCSPKDKTSPSGYQNRPQVPPRTKFLSPSERLVASPSPPHITTSVSNLRSKAPPNLTLSSPQEDSDSPKTPLKPTMGVSMIGKQRRTPGAVLSPREILPEYPGMEYPPTFEPESYTLNPSPEHVYTSTPQPPPKGVFRRTLSPVSEVPGSQFPPKPLGSSPGYVNISHVSNTMADLNLKSYHHNIYVTSPCKSPNQNPEGRGERRQPPPVPPNKPSRSPAIHLTPTRTDNTQLNGRRIIFPPVSLDPSSPQVFSVSPQGPANEYVSMGMDKKSPRGGT